MYESQYYSDFLLNTISIFTKFVCFIIIEIYTDQYHSSSISGTNTVNGVALFTL